MHGKVPSDCRTIKLKNNPIIAYTCFGLSHTVTPGNPTVTPGHFL